MIKSLFLEKLLMRMFNLRVVSMFMAIAFSLVTAGCVTTQTNSVTKTYPKQENTLRVGISANAPPIAFKSENKLKGLEVDLARQLGQHLQKQVLFTELDWEEQISALENDSVDILMSGLTITAARSYRVAFSKPYMRSGQIFLVRLEDRQRYADGIYSIMGAKPTIGTISGTTGDLYISRTVNKATIINFDYSENAVNALLEKKIDVFVHDAPIICHYAATNEGNKLVPILKMGTEEYLAWAVSHQNKALLAEVNSFIAESSAKGTLQTTISRWIPYLR